MHSMSIGIFFKLLSVLGYKDIIEKEYIDNNKEINDQLLIDAINKQIKMRRNSNSEFKKTEQI